MLNKTIDQIFNDDEITSLDGSERLVARKAGATGSFDIDRLQAFFASQPLMNLLGNADASAVDEDAAVGTSTFNQGDVYIVTVAQAAPHAFSDISQDLAIGDWVYFTAGGTWKKQDGTDFNASEIKILYESNGDTNAFTDADETKLDGIEAGAEVNIPATTVSEVFIDGVGYDKNVDDFITLNLEPTSDSNLQIWFEGSLQPRSTWSRVAKVVTFTAVIPIDIDEIEADIFVGTGGDPVVTSDTGVVIITEISQAAYDLLAPPNADTLYLITS